MSRSPTASKNKSRRNVAFLAHSRSKSVPSIAQNRLAPNSNIGAQPHSRPTAAPQPPCSRPAAPQPHRAPQHPILILRSRNLATAGVFLHLAQNRIARIPPFSCPVRSRLAHLFTPPKAQSRQQGRVLLIQPLITIGTCTLLVFNPTGVPP